MEERRNMNRKYGREVIILPAQSDTVACFMVLFNMQMRQAITQLER